MTEYKKGVRVRTVDSEALASTAKLREELAAAWEQGWQARHNYDERGGEAPPTNPYEADQ